MLLADICPQGLHCVRGLTRVRLSAHARMRVGRRKNKLKKQKEQKRNQKGNK